MNLTHNDHMMFKSMATKQLEARVKDLEMQLFNQPKLVNIERVERTLRFTFQIGTQFYKLETMSLMTDNTPEWREKLIP